MKMITLKEAGDASAQDGRRTGGLDELCELAGKAILQWFERIETEHE